MTDLHLVIITGLSGAGKSQAIRALEDIDFFCVDNLPPVMLKQFILLLSESIDRRQIPHVAVCIDIRAGVFFDSINEALQELVKEGISFEILFLEASNETLLRRYKEARRPHPLSPQGRLQEGLSIERQRMKPIKEIATQIVDTSKLTVHQLKAQIRSLYMPKGEREMQVFVTSFGFKYGLPEDSDLVFDVRFLPNPHWIPELRPLTGQNQEVQDYIGKQEATAEFIASLTGMIDLLLPHYAKEGKNHLVIAIGCTGGRHRSVAISIALADFIKSKDYFVQLDHRDLDAIETVERVP